MPIPRRDEEQLLPFARFGSEKMIYDIRMGPQGLFHDGSFFVAYQAAEKGGCAHPHIIRRDVQGRWSQPVRLGRVTVSDHHMAPILWADARRHLHVLYNAHFTLNQSRHLVSAAPLDIRRWVKGPPIAPSITYPRILTYPDGRRVLYYRALGHMGYWTCKISPDGAAWDVPAPPLVDFDRDPEVPGDEWAGSYHSVALSRDGNALHIAFVRWDERHRVNPLYKRFLNLWSRYDLYYVRLDLRAGRLLNIEGDPVERPINRRIARERCLVWDTGERIVNVPSILADEQDRPQFLFPVAGNRLDRCRFWFIRREGDGWRRHAVAAMDNIWNGSHLEYDAEGGITAFLIGRETANAERLYGGGRLEEWRSADGGRRWRKVGEISLPEGYLANNPKPVEDLAGRPLPRTLLFFGWKGPEAIPSSGPFRGGAYLWCDWPTSPDSARFPNEETNGRCGARRLATET